MTSTLIRPVPPVELPRWDAPHHCGDHSAHVQTWSQQTRFGSAVWLVQECQVCGETWDVLADTSAEAVIVAAVYPVWAITGCGLCSQECADGCRCLCHDQGIDTPEVPSGQVSIR